MKKSDTLDVGNGAKGDLVGETSKDAASVEEMSVSVNVSFYM